MGAAALSRQKMAAARERLIVALDFATPREAEVLVTGLGDTVSFYKIGLELAYGGGLPFDSKYDRPFALLKLFQKVPGPAAEGSQRLDILRDIEHRGDLPVPF